MHLKPASKVLQERLRSMSLPGRRGPPGMAFKEEQSQRCWPQDMLQLNACHCESKRDCLINPRDSFVQGMQASNLATIPSKPQGKPPQKVVEKPPKISIPSGSISGPQPTTTQFTCFCSRVSGCLQGPSRTRAYSHSVRRQKEQVTETASPKASPAGARLAARKVGLPNLAV